MAENHERRSRRKGASAPRQRRVLGPARVFNALDAQHCCLLEETSSSSLICLLTVLFSPEKTTVQALKEDVARLTRSCMYCTHTHIYSTEAPKQCVAPSLQREISATAKKPPSICSGTSANQRRPNARFSISIQLLHNLISHFYSSIAHLFSAKA